MGLTRSQMDAELAALYDQIPQIPDCDGRCWTSCGPIGLADRERQRIRQAGVRITPYEVAMQNVDRFWCDALTGDRRCAVYELRPMVCRLWGAVEGMQCPHGCVPEGGRWLSDDDGLRLVAESLRIGGGHRMDGAAGVDEELAKDHVRAEINRIRARGRAGELDRAAEVIPAAFRRTLG